MKTNQTMVIALLGIAACSFFFGLGQHEAPAGAITSCVGSCCEEIYSWWSGANGAHVAAAEVAGTVPPLVAGDNTKQAILWIYVQAQSPGGCSLVSAGQYAQWDFPSGSVECQNKDGTYPKPQQVTPNGTGTPPAQDSGKNVCGT